MIYRHASRQDYISAYENNSCSIPFNNSLLNHVRQCSGDNFIYIDLGCADAAFSTQLSPYIGIDYIDIDKRLSCEFICFDVTSKWPQYFSQANFIDHHLLHCLTGPRARDQFFKEITKNKDSLLIGECMVADGHKIDNINSMLVHDLLLYQSNSEFIAQRFVPTAYDLEQLLLKYGQIQKFIYRSDLKVSPLQHTEFSLVQYCLIL